MLIFLIISQNTTYLSVTAKYKKELFRSYNDAAVIV